MPPCICYCFCSRSSMEDLHRFMPRTITPSTTEQESMRLFSANLNENPAIAAYWFQKRWELFFKHVLQKKFKIKDYWWRYEWQFRGSSHVQSAPHKLTHV